MAVKDCDKVSNIIAVAIAAGDDDIAQIIGSLSAIKNDALVRSRNVGEEWVDAVTWLTAHELELRAASADIKIRAIVQGSILEWSKWNEAFDALAKEIVKTKGSIAWGTELLEKVRKISLADYNEVAKLWDSSVDPADAIKDLNDWLSQFVSSNYSIRKYSDFYEWEVASAKKSLKNGKITQEEYEKKIKNAHKEAMKKIAEWKSPKWYVSLDEEWKVINKVFGDDPDKAGRAWSQYVMARELLADWWLDDDLLKAFDQWGEALLWELTPKWIDECEDLDMLLARAFTNTEELYSNWTLRDIYRNKLTVLASWKKITKENAQKMKTLVNVSLFAEEWATLSDVLLDNRAYTSMKQMWYKVSERDGNRILNDLRSFSKKVASWKDKDIVDWTIKIAGHEVSAEDVIQLIYDITWDKNILSLVSGGNFTNGAILDIATQKLIWDDEAAKTALVKLFQKWKEWNKITNSRGIFLRAITGMDVPDKAKIWYFNYREWLFYKDELSSAKANLMDKIANKNKMRVVDWWIEDFTVIMEDSEENISKLAEKLKKEVWWGFLIVNDGWYKDNPLLRKALDRLEGDDSITILYPRGGMSSSFTMEDGVVYFKTTNDEIYDRMAWTISIQSMWESSPTREIMASAYEAKTWRNGDKIRYQPSYSYNATDNTGRQVSDQQYDFGFLMDKDKNLISFYHWTDADFDEFSLDYFRKWSGDSQVWWFYFTTEKEWKVMMPSQAEKVNRQIEVYIQASNPVRANTKITDIMSEGEFERMIKRWNTSNWIEFDADRRNYKIAEWFRWQSTIASVLSNVGTYDWIFWNDPKAFMQFFKEYTGIDWLRDWDKIFVAFSPEQIKYVDNRLPTSSANMKYQPAYHGSWYNFDVFDLKYVWMWAGGTAHWYGVYVTLDRDIARAYAVNNSFERKGSWKWLSSSDLNDSLGVLDILSLDDAERQIAFDVLDWMKSWKSFDEAVRIERESLESSLWFSLPEWKRQRFENKLEALWMLKEGDFEVWWPTRHLYEVEIPDDKKANTITWENYFNEDGVLTKRQINQFKKKLNEFNPEAWQKLAEWDYYIEWWNSLLLALEDVLWDKKSVSEFFESLWYDWYRYVSKESWNARILFRASDVKITDKTSRQLRTIDYMDQADISATDAVKVQMFTKDRTWEDIAKWYWIPWEYLHWTNMIQWVQAWGAYWNGVIYFTDMIKESTAPHELFHAVFNMYVGEEQYKRVLADWAKLFQMSEYDVEEMLADSFAHWFNTWEFTYWDELKKFAGKKRLNSEEKTFIEKVKEFFEDIAEMLWLLDNHRAEVNKMFEDIVNMNYLPDAWKPVNAASAMVQYNKELNNAAVNYFWKVLWYSTDKIDDEYVKRIETLLSDMLWMDIKTFDTFADNSHLWQRIDKQLSLERLTAWRFDREMVDIKQVRDEINQLSDADLSKQINDKFWVLVKWGTIEWNKDIDLIREARFDYNTAQNASDLLSAKWKIISLANWVQPTTLSIDDIKTMFQNKTFDKKYKELFFPNQELTKDDMALFTKQINSDIFDGLSIWFADNLIKAWYDLPLINTKKVVYDYLNGSLDLNSDFVQAFFYKNNIPFTKDNLDTIMDTMMPKKYSFDFNVLDGKLEDDSLVWTVSAVVESENRFLPDSYSALYAIEDSGRWVNLGNKEYTVLENMLDKYINAVLDWMNKWTLEFSDAQKLKQELSYALDTFEQDFVLPKYGQFLTVQQRQEILWTKYEIPIGVAWQPYNRVKEMLYAAKDRIVWRYRRTLWTMVENADINAAIAKWYNKEVTPKELQERIERRRNQLIANGSTIKEINWEYVVYSSKDALWETINSLPDNIQWLAWLKAMGREWIDSLTNDQAYMLLRYLEATKSLATTSNYAMQLMYKQSPQLAQYSFFSTYVIDPSTGLPRIMWGNALNMDTFFDNIASSQTADRAIKEDVFWAIINKFKKDWYILAESIKNADWTIKEKWLNDIIAGAVSRQLDEMQSMKFTPDTIEEARAKMQDIYTNLFVPYTYLKDIPDGWTTMLWTKLVDVKGRLETTMKEAYAKAVEDLKDAWATDWDRIQQMITVRLNDGQVLSLEDLSKLNIDSWKKQIFNDESIFVRWADEDAQFLVDDTETFAKQQEVKAEEKEYRERVQNEYLSSMQTILNQWQSIADAERELMTSFMFDVRTDLRKYDLTSKLVDALDALSWINEAVARWIKNYLLWFGWTVTFGKYKPGDIIARYKLVREAYEWYYNMTLEQLMKTKPLTPAEEVAWNTARYFKNLERLLGSVDWVKWITTSKEVNKAFYHLWEVFLNLSTKEGQAWVRWIFSMLSAIEQNQVLKFFKFSKKWQKSYVAEFIQVPLGADGKFLDWLGWYRDYVQTISWITRDEFNRLFGTNYTNDQFSRVLQWLTWFSYAWGTIMRTVNKWLDILNWSRRVFRFAMSYPGQLLTIPLQWTAYFLKQLWFESSLGIENLADIDYIREQFWILDWAYNELNIFGKLNFNPDSKDVNAFYNRYWVPDVREMLKETWITTADDYINMYAKIDSKYSKPWVINDLIRWFDPYKDNANNFVDWVFARNFKDVAFMKWLRDNEFMKFWDAKAFLDFMNDATISWEVKSQLLDAVAASAGRNFRNILWLGFWWLDRAIGAKWWHNVLFWLMQMLNFRWSWWQNIFKQTGAAIWNMLQFLGSCVWLSKASRDEVAKYIFYTPEFTNFTTALLNDMEWAFKLTRYQDNGRWPDEDEDWVYYFLDYLSYMGENMNMVSQRWQGIQSFGPIRPFLEQRESMLRSQMDPTVYTDTFWLWAFFNALGKNFLRQWKPINWLTELVWAYEEWWWANARAYIANRWMNLSFGTLRYMVNEDMNWYWYTYEVTWQEWWIPWIVMWEAQFGSDKSFMYELDNNETWDSMKIIADSSIPWEDKKVYYKNLRKAIVNGSQFFSALKNMWNIWPLWEYTKSFFTADDLSTTLQKTSAGKEFYQRWYVTPKTPAEADTFIKTILNHSEYRPWSKNFNKSLLQFEDYWHMDAWKWNKADAEMELWLEHIKYQTDGHWEFIEENWKKVVDPAWEALITNVKQFYANEEYVSSVIYNYAKAWLDIHNSDPNYQLYVKMLGQWQAHMMLENEIDRRVAAKNVWMKKDWKWSETNFKQAQYRDMLLEIGNSIYPWDNITFFERLNRLDEDDATLAALRIIQDQSSEEDRKTIEKFFEVKTSTVDWDIVEDISLKPQYESVLKQIGNMARAMDEWNTDRVVAMASSIANMYKDSDPTWMVTANLINSIFDRIYKSNYLSPEVKEEMMVSVFYANKEFIQRNPEEMRKLLWDNYDKFAELMNKMLYKWDWQVISNYESLITSGKKGSGGSGKLSNEIKKTAMNFWNTWGWTTKVWNKAGQWYWERVPVRIKWADLVKELWLKWYSPLNIKETVFKYTPHADFSIAKDVNRNIKKTQTQTVSTKKQLSNIEKKTTKALTAES